MKTINTIVSTIRPLAPCLVFLGIIAFTAVGANPQNFGDPLPGLDTDQTARFNAGKDEFEEPETPEDGLGPVFNDTSCVACHNAPNNTTGGGSTTTETRFGKGPEGKFDPMTKLGGSLIQRQGIGPVGSCNYVGETVPQAAQITAERRTTALFGLGLVDAVPDQTFKDIANEPQEVAVGGIVNMVTKLSPDGQPDGQAVGKFGWKAQVPSLSQFSGDAYLNEMGITSPQFPKENCPQGNCALLACLPTTLPVPNDDGTGVKRFTDFMTFLAPPPRGKITLAVMAGEQIFQTIGCASCHRPNLTTDPKHPVAVLRNKTFHPYSDFLLHDMGSLGDGIAQGMATEQLMRTAPLWGLRMIESLLHDGRARSVEKAILAHDGQAKKARDKFEALPPNAKTLLRAFLDSL